MLVYIHGGAWIIGDKREQGKPMMNELVAPGLGVRHHQLPAEPGATWPDQIVDCKRAIAWVRRHIADYGGDPSFIAVSGGSAGGHLAALAGPHRRATPSGSPASRTEDTSVDAGVPFYGVMDMTGTLPPAGLLRTGLLEMLERKVMKVPRTSTPRSSAGLADLRVNAGAPPFFVLPGGQRHAGPGGGGPAVRRRPAAGRGAPGRLRRAAPAQHAFDVLASLRCQATTAGVIAFLDAVRDGTPTGPTGGSADGPAPGPWPTERGGKATGAVSPSETI